MNGQFNIVLLIGRKEATLLNAASFLPIVIFITKIRCYYFTIYSSLYMMGGQKMVHREFLKLYDECYDDVYRYIHFKVGNSWDADDITEEVFKRAFEKFRTVSGSSRPWLFTIARNAVTDYYRRKKDVPGSEILDTYQHPYNFEEEFLKREKLGCLKNSLNLLNEEELEIINLRYFSEMKYGEIAIVLEKSENAVKMKAIRVMNKLRKFVTKCLEGKQ